MEPVGADVAAHIELGWVIFGFADTVQPVSLNAVDVEQLGAV